MINLIPNEEKKKMTKDFYLRLFTLSLIMLGMSLIVASIAILPSYFLSYAEENSINTNLESQKNESVFLPDQNISTIIKDLKFKLNLIENAQKKQATFSQRIINEIMLKKTPNIKITEISYQNDPQTGEQININGSASSREVLLSFRRVLENNAAFLKVDLPISNFVKGSNIKFYLSLIPNPNDHLIEQAL
jgi:Tfp pilus assembly protein PilN